MEIYGLIMGGASNTIKCQLLTRLCDKFLIINVFFAGMACPFCRMPSGPCSPFDSYADVFTVVLDRRCSRHAVRLTFLFVHFLVLKIVVVHMVISLVLVVLFWTEGNLCLVYLIMMVVLILFALCSVQC